VFHDRDPLPVAHCARSSLSQSAASALCKHVRLAHLDAKVDSTPAPPRLRCLSAANDFGLSPPRACCTCHARVPAVLGAFVVCVVPATPTLSTALACVHHTDLAHRLRQRVHHHSTHRVTRPPHTAPIAVTAAPKPRSIHHVHCTHLARHARRTVYHNCALTISATPDRTQCMASTIQVSVAIFIAPYPRLLVLLTCCVQGAWPVFAALT
jgi:hypothetical protein